MKHKRWTSGAVMAISLLATGIVTVQAMPSAGCDKGLRHAAYRADHKQGEPRLQRMMEHLDMDQAQRDKVRSLLGQNRSTLQEKQQSMHEVRQQLYRAGASEDYDAVRVKQLAEQQAQLSAELAQLRAGIFNQIYQVMTPAQKEKLKAMREHKMHRHD